MERSQHIYVGQGNDALDFSNSVSSPPSIRARDKISCRFACGTKCNYNYNFVPQKLAAGEKNVSVLRPDLF